MAFHYYLYLLPLFISLCGANEIIPFAVRQGREFKNLLALNII